MVWMRFVPGKEHNDNGVDQGVSCSDASTALSLASQWKLVDDPQARTVALPRQGDVSYVAYILDGIKARTWDIVSLTMTSTTANLDPYSAKAESHSYSPQEKITELHGIVKSCHAGMLTTRSKDGGLHSRAMVPVSPFEPTQLNLIFIANNATHKFDEIENDGHANVSFYNTASTSWASYSGIAKISRDPEAIKKYFSSSTMSAYFGDLKDGVHKGDETDPRVSIIELVPDEVRFWVSKKGAVGRAIDVTISNLTKNTSSPGDLITLTKAEIQLTQGLQTKQ